MKQLQQFHDGGLQIVRDELALVGFHGNQRVSGRIAVVEFATGVARRGESIVGGIIGCGGGRRSVRLGRAPGLGLSVRGRRRQQDQGSKNEVYFRKGRE